MNPGYTRGAPTLRDVNECYQYNRNVLLLIGSFRAKLHDNEVVFFVRHKTERRVERDLSRVT